MPAHENNLPSESACITRRSLLAAAAGAVASAAAPSKIAHASPAPSASTPSEAFVPLDVYLGASKRIVDELSAHEHDSYYLSTPFGNTGRTAKEEASIAGIAGIRTADRKRTDSPT